MKWYKRDPDAALVGMCGLSDEEYRAYNVTIDLLYSHDGEVADSVILSHLPWNRQRWERVRSQLLSKGKLHLKPSGNLTGNRVESELKLAKKRIESTKVARQKALEIKVRASLSTAGQPQPQPDKESTIAQGLPKVTNIAQAALERDFALFWKAYPRHVAKKAAVKALKAALRSASMDTIMAGLAKAKPHWHDKQFIPYPATWLNRAGWEDDLSTTNFGWAGIEGVI